MNASKSVFFSLFTALCLLSSCANKETHATLLESLNKLPDFKLLPHTKVIAVIADGSCIPCNQSFSNFIANAIDDTTVQIVIAAHANHLDLTPYIHSERKNIIYDSNSYLTGNGIIKGSTIMFTNNGRMDTTITIETKQLEQQLAYIKSRMAVAR